MQHNTIEMTGRTFGRLRVLTRNGSTPDGQALWRCECVCGTETTVRGSLLRRGITTSCGCALRDWAAKTKTTHGLSKSPEYQVWNSMFTRCTNPNHIAYANYGGRGIRVCKRWEKFENFFADMGPRPSDLHTLDRIDNDKGYSPKNCQWATRRKQNNNRRDNRRDESGVSLPEAIALNGSVVSRKTAHKRLKLGWDFQRAVSTPSRRFTWR